MIEKNSVERDESDLIARAYKGDKDAFGELVKRYSKAVYGLAYRFVREHDAADDLTQEAFIKAYQAMNTFIVGKSFRNWIFTIVSNLAINYLKRHKRQVSLEDSIPDDILKDQKVSSNPHSHLEAKDLKKSIAEAVQRLPEDYKAVFILRTYEEMSYEEIARVLKIEVGTVMSRLFRARARLKDELKDYLYD
jgi:RNA polymerase sigma-70 factor (ECF subfamily)